MRADLPIAVIDDDAAACAAMIDLLGAMGFAAIGFAGALAFLRSHHARRVCCVITDMRMAVMSGLDLCRHLAADGNPVPTILVTAYPDETTRKQAQSLGVGAYLAKPCDPDELLQALHALLTD
ncbi:response regulator [Geminicoccus flavidas]|uniref:response regulator n=1 Tax=Geminicoccus flavidas TaxID=2506407 RepID=UPI00135AD14F|nr:response regulator [Geminicoccus flavidas]